MDGVDEEVEIGPRNYILCKVGRQGEITGADQNTEL